MGELIRNIKEIELGNERLMIELNEGYTKHEGRLIHIQNKKFRYLLKERQFMELASTVIRAKEEMDYYKENQALLIEKKDLTVIDKIEKDAEGAAKYFSTLFEDNGIDYRLIETGNGFVTFIVNNDDYPAFSKKIKKKLNANIHVYGHKMGYKFLYQMRPFEMYSYNNVFVEFYFQLPCMSMTPKMWIPLDRILQTRVWNEKEKNADGMKILDDVSFYVYRLCWSVFKKQGFDENDRALLNGKSDVLDDVAFKQCMDKVFFAFTDSMIAMLKRQQYDEIIPEYYRFREY